MRVRGWTAHLYRSWLRGFLLYKLLTLVINALTFPVLQSRRPARLPDEPQWSDGSQWSGGSRWSDELQPPDQLQTPSPSGVTPPAASRPAGGVSLLVPARNEARTLPWTLPGLLAQGGVEVIVLDDCSQDGTGDLARRLGDRLPRAPGTELRVLSGQPRPPGWHGKAWACQQLGQAARGEVLVFTDADVLWHPGALDAVLAELGRRRADLLSVWPRQATRRPGERLLTPLVDDALLGLLPAPLLRLPSARLSAGNGQLMAFRRAAYQRVGGHALVRAEVLEDMLFARRLKARGGRLALALGGDLLSVRMYQGYAESVVGLSKSLPVAHGHSRRLLALSWWWHLAVYTLPLLFGPRRLVLLGLAARLGVNLKTGRRRPADLAEVLLTPLIPLASLPVYLLALRGRYDWKGRSYVRGAASLPFAGMPGEAQ